MKPKIKKIGTSQSQSFEIMEVNEAHFFSHWHYHPQFEIMYVLESTGTRIVGDSVKRFNPGEIVVLGPNVPHIWKNDAMYYDKTSNKKAVAIVVYFDADFLGNSLENIPELYETTEFLYLSRQGLLLQKETSKAVAGFLRKMIRVNGIDRLIYFFNIIKAIGHSKNYQILSNNPCSSIIPKRDFNKINLVYQFSLDRFRKKITISDMSELVNMSPNAFCRYFKSMTGKTFIHFINELRIGEACRLIMENNLNFTQICYEVGFENYSNFIRQFKKIKGTSPKVYQGRIKKSQMLKGNV